MAAFKDIQLNAIEKKTLVKQADELYRSTNCESSALIGKACNQFSIPSSFQGRGGEIAIQVSLS